MSVGFFLGAFQGEHLGGKWWITTKPLCYQYGSRLFVVPAGFVNDLDSVPRVPVIYAAFRGRSVRPAVLHDWLYRQAHDRAEADRIFLDAMDAEGIPGAVRYPMYWAVRACGWTCYKPLPGVLDPR